LASRKVKKALAHEDKYGEGAKARRAADLSEPEEYAAIETERKQGTLHAGGSGKVVTNPAQAKAIAHSEFERKKKRGSNSDGNIHGPEY
jgi:hypothetical protein